MSVANPPAASSPPRPPPRVGALGGRLSDGRELDWTAMARRLSGLTPHVEVMEREGVLLDLTGVPGAAASILQRAAELVRRAFVPPLSPVLVQVAAPGTRVARALLRWRSRPRRPTEDRPWIVPPQSVESVLEHLPTWALGLPDPDRLVLETLGLKTVGALRRIEGAGGAARLPGSVRIWLHAVAAGDQEPVRPAPAEILDAESCVLDEPVEAVEPLLFSLAPALERLVARAARRNEAGIELRLVCRGGGMTQAAEQVLRFPEPVTSARVALRAIQLRLESAVWTHPVEHVTVEWIRCVTIPMRQQDAFRAAQATPDVVQTLVLEAQARWGADRVGVLTDPPADAWEARTQLVWPPPSPPRWRLDPDVLSEGGRFEALWPWPVLEWKKIEPDS